MKTADVAGAVKRAAGRIAKRKPRYARDVSGAGLQFIGRFEGCPRNPDGTLRVYDDPVGYATVGFGRLLHYSNFTTSDVAKYHGYTITDAYRMLHQDTARFVAAVNALGVNLVQHELDALVSFAFNCGTQALTGGIKAALLRGDKQAAMNTLRQYDHAGGRVLSGLARRREAEANLFLHGTY